MYVYSPSASLRAARLPHLWYRSFFVHSAPAAPRPVRRAAEPGREAVVFYRWPAIKHLRLLSRFKLYQATLMAAFLPPATFSYQHGTLSGGALMAAWGATGGTLALLLSLSLLSTRVVGEMAYLPDAGHVRVEGHVRVSTLTFMGYRRDLVVPVEHLLPQEDGRGGAKGRALQWVELVGHYRLFLYSLRYGVVTEEKLANRFLHVR